MAEYGRRYALVVTALAENRYGRRRAHVTRRPRDLKIVYNSDQRCRSSPFLSLALNPYF